MPVLDARALETDPEGMSFLRDVLGRAQPAKSPAPGKLRRKAKPIVARPPVSREETFQPG